MRSAITQQQKSALTGSIIFGPLTQVLVTLAVLAEGLSTQASGLISVLLNHIVKL